MKLCFLIYSWFPYGGQQRDFLRVVEECVRRGYKVQIYTMKWRGEQPAGVTITLVPVRSISRHGLYQRFTKWVSSALANNPVDVIAGFNKMPGLDVYYAADPCFAEKAENQRGWYYRFLPRYRHFSEYERAVFAPPSKTLALILSPLQREQFIKHYPGCEARLFDLPAGIAQDRRAPVNTAEVRREFRQDFSLSDEDFAVVQIGSGFQVKGVDRSLRAIASLPAPVRDRVKYLLVGQDKAARFKRLASKLGISDRVHFLGGRDDVPRFLLGCDLLLHPAYSESAGYVLLEAVVAGLPVLTTDTCGFAFHVEQAGAGQVCASPFRQEDLNRRLQAMLLSDERDTWRANGLRYAETADIYRMPQAVVDILEQYVADKQSAPIAEDSAHAVPAR